MGGKIRCSDNVQKSLKSGNFTIAMLVIHKVFSLAHPLSVSLQAKNNDLASAIEMADN